MKYFLLITCALFVSACNSPTTDATSENAPPPELPPEVSQPTLEDNEPTPEDNQPTPEDNQPTPEVSEFTLKVSELATGDAFATSYDAATDTVTATLGNLTRADLPLRILNQSSSFSVYTDSATYFVVRKETKNARARHVVRLPFVDNEKGAGVSLEVLTDGTLPQTGTATFNGDYMGFVGKGKELPYDRIYAIVGGKVTLNADLENASISGAITERTLAINNGSNTNIELTYSDITLAPATIGQNGQFQGTSSKGELISTSRRVVQAGEGTWSGTFAGPNGEEAVGTVGVGYTVRGLTRGSSNKDYVEQGVFHATR